MNQRLLFSLGALAGAGLATLVLQTDVLPSAWLLRPRCTGSWAFG